MRRHLLPLLSLLLSLATPSIANSIIPPSAPSPSALSAAQNHHTATPTQDLPATTLTPPTGPRAPGPDPTLSPDAGAELVHLDLRATDSEAGWSEPTAFPTPWWADGKDCTANEARRAEIDERFVQTTYYSCVTIGTYCHCGWHEPILDAGAMGRWRDGCGRAAARAAAVAGVVGGVLLVR